MTNDERNNRIAEALDRLGMGELAWETAQKCPQGHWNTTPHGVTQYPVGTLCGRCLLGYQGELEVDDQGVIRCFGIQEQLRQEVEAHRQDLLWHPEWRIGHVARDFTKADTLYAAFDAWWAPRGHDGVVAIVWVGASPDVGGVVFPSYYWRVAIRYGFRQGVLIGNGQHTQREQALAEAWITVLGAEKGVS